MAKTGPNSAISQHIGWLKMFASSMDETNWRDMKLRIERQLEMMVEDTRPEVPR